MALQDPGKTVAKAHMLGLRALVNLLRERTIRETRHLYSEAQNRLNSAIKKWEKSFNQGLPDFALVADIEKKLRDIELENIWETTARYGNTERRRFRNEREGPVGPLNKLINIFGAKLRDYFLLMNPLPSPGRIGKRKSKTVWGYASTEYGNVPVAHGADLAELDLADMLRSHGRELSRKSFISGVQPDVFDKYALLLIRRLAPFVDHIYTNGRLGKRSFLRSKVGSTKKPQSGLSADEVLREMVDEIDALYGKPASQRIFPSRVRQEHDSPPTSLFFQDQIRRLEADSLEVSKEEAKPLLAWASYLKKLTKKKKPKLRNQDAEYLYRLIRNRARWEGDKCHSFAADGLPQPYRLESVILDGARFLQPGDDFLITGETRFKTAEGPGRADLVVYVSARVSNPNRPGQLDIMKPVAVFEIKTKTGFEWEISAQKSKGKRKKTVPKLVLRKRVLTDNEWDEAVSETPSKSDIEQLKLYEAGIIKEYRDITEDGSLDDLLKGVIVLDTQYDSSMNRDVVRALLKDLCKDIVWNKHTKGCDRLLVRYRESIAERAAVVLLAPSESQFAALQTGKHITDTIPVYNPFPEATESSSRHILYLSARSASNSGHTASWIAKYWHGLQYAHRLCKETTNASVIWLDLAGVFADPELARIRLRVHTQEKNVQSFFDNITFIDLSSAVDGFLFKGKNLPDLESIYMVDDKEPKEKLMVVSGWNWVEGSLPPRLKSALAELERYMVQVLTRSGCMTLWFLDPKPDEMTSEKYRSRCLLPFWDSSPHQPYITELVWNLPVRPYSSNQTTPMLDDLRVIVHQKKNAIDAALIEVPPLENWSSRFWSKRSKRKFKKKSKNVKGRTGYFPRDIISNKGMSEELINDSIDLIPWLRALHPDKLKEKETETRLTLSIQAIPLYGDSSHPKSVMSRVIYQARLKGARGRRSFVPTSAPIPKQRITHPRHYRRWRKRERRIVSTEIYSPPKEVQLEYRQYREQTACNVEIRRLRQATKSLGKQKGDWSSNGGWRDFFARLQKLLPSKKEKATLEHLNKISELLMVDEASSDLWSSLLWVRERRLGLGLRLLDNEKLESLLGSRPYVANFFGNYLLLLLLAITRRYPGLRLEQIQTLWESMKAWHLRQLGFCIRTRRGEQSRPKYDTRAIWSNLSKRASVLMAMPQLPQSAVRYGQLVISPHGDDYDYWVILEDEYDRSRLHSGLWIGQNPLSLATTPRWSESNHQELANHATDVKTGDAHDLLISEIDGVEYVWLFAEDEWNLQGELITIPRKSSAVASIRGIQVKMPQSSEIQPPAGVEMPSNLEQRIKNELAEIAVLRQHVLGVRCELGIESGMYAIAFELDGELIDKRIVHRTSDLLQILRRPLIEGTPLQSSPSSNAYMTWNPYQDIEYGELQLLRPYVEKKTPYVHVRVPLPQTCQKLIEQPPMEMAVIISHDESECPIIDGSAMAHGLCWKLKSEKHDIDMFVDRPLSDYDVSSLLVAQEVFLEGSRLSLDIQFENNPEAREGWVFRESKRIARALDLKPYPPGVFMHLDTERLQCTLVKDGGSIQISLRSDIRGERVSSGALIPPEGKWQIRRILDGFNQDTKRFVETYFGKNENLEDRIMDYAGVLDELERILLMIKRDKL
ncbi:MAG: hypothetical protein ACFFER_01770 [Candidatus Thorarchaeota archaeon]